MPDYILLEGLDGANPLAFLAALGTLSLSSSSGADVKLAWHLRDSRWRPGIHGVGQDQASFVARLHAELKETSDRPFSIDSKLPFAVGLFYEALREACQVASASNRRELDLLTAFGSEVVGNTEDFADTAWRMVRSGDSAGQGLPAYARKIREATGPDELRRALFHQWLYTDQGFSLRWDPSEDARYALRWRDPSKSTGGVVLGANALALEGLVFFPTVPNGPRLRTTGFRERRRRSALTWPIWDQPIDEWTVRALVSSAELQREEPRRDVLSARGVVDVYRAGRIAPNQYYKNFTPAVSI